MSIFKRGRVYWYEFTFRGERIQQSTRQGNQNVARQMEAAHRTALAKGEVGIVRKATAPTLERFCRDRIEPWASGRFEQNTWRWYRAGLRTIYGYPALAFLKLDGDAFEEAVNRLEDDQAILNWVRENGVKHSSEAIEQWNEAMISRHPDTAAKKARFAHFLKEAGGDGRQDIRTYFDFIEFDEGRLK